MLYHFPARSCIDVAQYVIFASEKLAEDILFRLPGLDEGLVPVMLGQLIRGEEFPCVDVRFHFQERGSGWIGNFFYQVLPFSP